MVARITTPAGILETLNYNEKKVQKGTAFCIGSGNFLKDPEKMNFYQKLAIFTERNARNERAATKTMHISLNFDPSEKLSKDMLNEIADSYMEKIGFGEQPYLVYLHQDAGHPHVHIVTSTIKEDGKRISTHNIGRNQSEKARKEIEKQFQLVRAEDQKHANKNEIRPLDTSKVLYGRSETKRGITNVLNQVITKYNYTSLPELNAVLMQFNVMADRGQEGSIVFKRRGLLYRVLDANCSAIGVPIKASSINNKPTLEALEKRFLINQENREPLKLKIRSAIDTAITERPGSLKDLVKNLERKQIYTVIRQNAEGRMYGITFVDNKNKSVFNGSDIGKGYSIGGLQSKILNTPVQSMDHNSAEGITNIQKEKHKGLDQNKPQPAKDLLHQLMAPNPQSENTPFQLLKKKKKKKRNPNVNNW